MLTFFQTTAETAEIQQLTKATFFAPAGNKTTLRQNVAQAFTPDIIGTRVREDGVSR